MKKLIKDYIDNDHNFDKSTMIGIMCLSVVISGIFGWLYEFIFYYFNSGMKHFYMRGGNFLPWINIYAIGAIMIYYLTYKKRNNPLKVFLVSLVTCGLLELLSGWFLYSLLGLDRCWNYNEEILNFGNIGGFVCLRSVLFFGASALLFMYVILPLIFYIAAHMDKKTFLIISISLCGIFIIDEVYNLVVARLISMPRASTIYRKIGFNYMSFK